MTSKPRTWYLIIIALPIVGLDQLTKFLVTSNLAQYESWIPADWLAPIVKITHIHNTGAAFGIFPAGSLFFTVVGLVVTSAILYYYHQVPAGQWWIRSALGLQFGGALGNLADRLLQGYVTDFINFSYFPVFNVADSAIFIGVVILVIALAREEETPAQLESDDSPAPSVEGDALSG